jgi:hypothetical protein
MLPILAGYQILSLFVKKDFLRLINVIENVL